MYVIITVLEALVKASKDLFLLLVEKTSDLLFGFEKVRTALTNFQLFVNIRPVVFVERGRNLTVIRANCLTFTYHINALLKRSYCSFKTIYSFRSFFLFKYKNITM